MNQFYNFYVPIPGPKTLGEYKTLKAILKKDVTGGGPRIVGPEYFSSGYIWRFPNVLLCASGAHLVSDANSNSTFIVLRPNGANLPL